MPLSWTLSVVPVPPPPTGIVKSEKFTGQQQTPSIKRITKFHLDLSVCKRGLVRLKGDPTDTIHRDNKIIHCPVQSKGHQMVSGNIPLKAEKVIPRIHHYSVELSAARWYGCYKFTSSRGSTGQTSGRDTLRAAKEEHTITDLGSQ